MWLGAHVAVSLRDTGAKGKDGAGEACHCPPELKSYRINFTAENVSREGVG